MAVHFPYLGLQGKHSNCEDTFSLLALPKSCLTINVGHRHIERGFFAEVAALHTPFLTKRQDVPSLKGAPDSVPKQLKTRDFQETEDSQHLSKSQDRRENILHLGNYY